MGEAPTGGNGQLFRIGEIARRASVRPDTLRYYERIGLLKPQARSPGGYRLYAPSAVDRLAFIQKAQMLGLSLNEAGAVIRDALDGSPPCDHVREKLRARLRDVDERIAELQALRGTLTQAIERSERLPVMDGCLCGIIESVEEES